MTQTAPLGYSFSERDNRAWVRWGERNRTVLLDEIDEMTTQDLEDFRSWLVSRLATLKETIAINKAALSKVSPGAGRSIQIHVTRQVHLRGRYIHFAEAIRKLLKDRKGASAAEIAKNIKIRKLAGIGKAEQEHQNYLQTRIAQSDRVAFRRTAQRLLAKDQYDEILDTSRQYAIDSILGWAKGRDDVDNEILMRLLRQYDNGKFTELLP